VIQFYLLAIAYLLVGSAFLLSDSFGIRFPLLLSLRFKFRNSKRLRRLLVLGGIVLAAGVGFVPFWPGPVLLGDLVPMANILALCIWYGFCAYRTESLPTDDPGSVLEATGKYVERNKRFFGYLTAVVACLHFLVPGSVLL
jgi:hypothetical protein